MPARRPASQVARAHAFGERIRQLRREQKLTQRDVAERIPISAGHLSRLETGDHGPPPDEVIVQLADVLGADHAELMRLAGREAGGPSFERQILADIERLRQEIRQGFEDVRRALKHKPH